MTSRATRSGASLIAVTPPRYASKDEWVSDLVEIANAVVSLQEQSEIAHAFTPIARWAVDTRNEYTLRRVALEVIRHAEKWTELRELGIRARAIVAAAPHKKQERSRGCGHAPRAPSGRLTLVTNADALGQAALDALEAEEDYFESEDDD